MFQKKKSGGFRLKLAWLGVFLALLIPVWFAISALGVKFGFWDYQLGFGTMTRDWGGKAVLAGLAFGAVMLLLGLLKAPRTKVIILSFLILMICGLAMGRMLATQATAKSLPPIHDVQTDWSNPIRFTEQMMDERGEGSNPVLEDPKLPDFLNAMEAQFEKDKAEAQETAMSRFLWNAQKSLGMTSETFHWSGLAGKPVSEVQADAYPQLQSLVVSDSAADAYAAGIAVIEELGFEFVSRSRDDGKIEATASSRWFGFKDDVAIRIRTIEGNTVIDIRSISRVGLSDLGANAARVELMLEALRERLTEI